MANLVVIFACVLYYWKLLHMCLCSQRKARIIASKLAKNLRLKYSLGVVRCFFGLGRHF